MAERLSDTHNRASILDSIMSNWDPKYDKRQGSIVYDSVIAGANEIAQVYLNVDDIYDNMFPDTADRETLIRRFVPERGVEVEYATPTVSKGVFNAGAQVTVGSRFNQGALNFVVTGAFTDPETGEVVPDTYVLQCETSGSVGNAYLGKLTPITSVPGMTSGVLTEILIHGRDDESTESIRAKVMDSFDSKPFGGNVAQYVQEVELMDGVGGAKVKRRTDNTVDVWIISEDFTSPSSTLIDSVQTALDPVPNSGDGIGLAPIGHRVHVMGVTDEIMNISVKVDFVDPETTWEDVLPAITAQIESYFKGLAESWDVSDFVVVRISELISRIVTIGAILDVTEVLLNGSDTNIILDNDKIPVLGELTRIAE